MKLAVKIGLTVLTAIMTVGCGAKEEASAVIPEEQESIQIGMSFDSFVIERWQRERDVFVSTAKELGADVNVQIANGDTAEQEEQIQYFIDKKMDVIVVIAADSEALGEILGKAKSAGIKVIAYDRLVRNADVDLYISFDNGEVGRLMAETLIQENPDGGNIIAVYGSPVDNNVSIVVEKFENEINKSRLKIIYFDYADGWLAEKAIDIVDEGLMVNDDIVGVMCGNDDLASQAIRVLSEKRLAGKVSLVGQDADLQACQRIVEGTQSMTVYKPVEMLAKTAAEYAVELAEGKGIEGMESIHDGTYEVPYVKLMPIRVTADNIDEVIIGGGFHYKDEVYMNVSE